MRLDKFYTVSNVVDSCLASIPYDWNQWDLILEPSAGNGSFLTKLPASKRYGIDISPDHPEVVEQDFFTYTPPTGRILVIGNPPFGKVSSLAIKFFNHASKWAEVIAFIVPRTFRKVSVQNKLDPRFHLMLDQEIPVKPCGFEPPMMVKCCFQVWEKRTQVRETIEQPLIHHDWSFLPYGPKDDRDQPTPPQGADFAIRAYGGKCGEIMTEGLDQLRPKSWHFIKANIAPDELMRRFKQLNYSDSLNTARQNSLGKAELVSLYVSYTEAEK
jgi:hypothetical protein